MIKNSAGSRYNDNNNSFSNDAYKLDNKNNYR